jgi:hypothetical protein
MNLIKSCCLFVVFSSFLACTSQVSDVKSVSYTEFVNPFIGTDFTGNTYPAGKCACHFSPETEKDKRLANPPSSDTLLAGY